MKRKPYPELPKDLRHPGDLLSSEDARAPEPSGAAAVGPSEEPIFDDPIIGWWENAWVTREAAGSDPEPLV